MTIPLSAVIGLFVTAWQALNLRPTPAGISQVTTALQSLWQSLSPGRASQDTIHFAVFLIIFFWIMGYVSTWFLVRKRNPWVGVALGMVTIIANLSNLSEKYYGFFLLFLLSTLLLVAATTLARRRTAEAGIAEHPDWRSAWALISALVLSGLLLGGAWFAPQVRSASLETAISTRMPSWRGIDSASINLFAAVPEKESSVKSARQENLLFSDPVNLSDDVQFVVTSTQRPAYFRAQRYDVYQTSGWTSSPSAERLLGQGTPLSDSGLPAARNLLTYTVVDKLKSDLFLASGEYVTSDIAVLLHILIPASLPGDQAKQDLEAASAAGAQKERETNVSITVPRLLKAGEGYRVMSVTSAPSAEQLRLAGESYPQWVTDHYLQLPASLPARMRNLSGTVTRQTKTPYDKAVAVKGYLSRFTYDQRGTAPPEGSDGVDSFLYVHRSGNCTNFASAMVVMLRASGVPARLATGYLARTWDALTGTVGIRARDYHAWPEVYFPAYGWVEFEATPLPDNAGTVASSTEDPAAGITTEADTSTTDTGSLPFSASWMWLPLAALGLVLLLLGLRAVSRWSVWSINRMDYSSSTYARMCFLASLIGLRPAPHQTPLEYSARLVSAFPTQAESIGALTMGYLKARFSPHKTLDRQGEESLRRSWRAVAHALLKRRLRV